jgi:DNA-binding CsgD family transcriptional regulator
MSAVTVPNEADALIGREYELTLVRSFLRASAERGSYLVLCGDPGVGKTAILDAAADAATANTLVLRASGVQYETDMSFSGLNQLLLQLKDGFRELDPDLAVPLAAALGLDDGPRPDRDTVAEAALAVLRAAATACPVVMIVDDLQWLDPASTAVLEFLARHAAGSPIGLLASYRLGVDFAFDRRRFRSHELQPLPDTEAKALVSGHFPNLSAPILQRVLEEARGNPLALIELPTALSGDRLAAPATRPDVLPLTQRLNMLYASTISALPETTRTLLLLAALDGNSEVPTLQAAAPDCDVNADLAAAINARLITNETNPRRIAFRHPLIRSAVVAISTGAERRAAHRALASAHDGDPDRRVWHLADATAEPDESIAAQLEETANRSRRRGDPVAAASALARSADLSPTVEERTRRSALAAYLEADVTGDLQQAMRRLTHAPQPDTGSPASLQSAMTSAFVAFNGDGNIDFAHRVLTAAITDALDRGNEDADNAPVVEAIHNLLEVCLYGARPELWTSFFNIVGRRGYDGAPLLRLWTDTMADPARTATHALADLDQAIHALPGERDPTRIERVATAAIYVDRVRHCRPVLMRVIENARTDGAITAAINALMIVCVDDMRTGRWDEAHTLTVDGIALCEAHGYQLLSWPLQLARALLSAGRGDHSTTHEVTGAMSRWADQTGAHGLHNFAHHALAISALGRGDYAEAYAHACAISRPGVLAPNVGHALWAAFDLVEAAFRANRHSQAQAHAAALRDAGVAKISPRLALIEAASTAIVSADQHFEPLFEKALAVSGVEDWPFERARVELLYGERLRRTRAISAARLHLTVAVQIFEDLGAAPFAARAKAELHAAGLAPQRDVSAAAAALTPQEYQVALRAASGMTNKQIAERLGITHRTVGAHLEQIFPKLAINSRAALREALAAIDPASDGESA